jgi:DNA primase small subunit
LPEEVDSNTLSAIDSWQGTDDKIQGWQKTSLNPYIRLFRDHVNRIMKDERVAEERGREENGEGVGS